MEVLINLGYKVMIVNYIDKFTRKGVLPQLPSILPYNNQHIKI